MKALAEQNYYELLEVGPHASMEEIDAAFERLSGQYAPDSVVLYGLLEPEEVEALQQRLREAKAALGDEEQRAAYDRSIGLPPWTAPAAKAAPEHPVEDQAMVPSGPSLLVRGAEPSATASGTHSPPQPQAPEINSDTEFTGELLRRFREYRGLTLSQLANRTRISIRHLENVEADHFGELPVTVYLRGILMNLARELRLDPLQVCSSYLQRVAKHQAK